VETGFLHRAFCATFAELRLKNPRDEESARMSTITRKITIVGSGAIGATVAWSLLLRNAGIEVILVNRDGRKAWANAFDMSHCAPELPARAIRAGTVEDSAGSDALVLTAGVLPRENGTRAEVLRDNVEVYRGMVPDLAERSHSAVFLAVTNPVDAMAYAAWRLAGLPPGRVIASGTALDAMRLRGFAAEAYGLEARRVRIEVIGEHGDTMVPLWSRATYGSRPLAECLTESGADFGDEAKAQLLQRTKRAGWDIRQAGEHSSYGIAFSAARILEAVLGLTEERLDVSAPFAGEYGIERAFMSLPTRLGPGGILERDAPALAEGELAALRASAAAVRALMDEVDGLLGA
jgi:L-lactate dehydrogenase